MHDDAKSDTLVTVESAANTGGGVIVFGLTKATYRYVCRLVAQGAPE